MKRVEVTLRGVVELLMHNSKFLSDPIHPISRAIKQIADKGKRKTEDDYREMGHLEFIGGLYVNEKKVPIIPTHVLEATAKSGAKKQRMGKQLEAAMQVEKDAILQYEGPKDPEKLWGAGFWDRSPAKVNGGSGVIRTRPKFSAGWGVTFVMRYNEELLNFDDLSNFWHVAGDQCGIGDWRPKYGRFEVVSIKKL
jgi:hypothetical protein